MYQKLRQITRVRFYWQMFHVHWRKLDVFSRILSIKLLKKYFFSKKIIRKLENELFYERVP